MYATTALSAGRRFGLASFLLSACVALLLAASAEASFPAGTNGKVAVARSGGIWVLTLAGNGLLGESQLTADGINPAWSADGSKLAFNRGGDIYTMDADGSGVTQVTSGTFTDSRPAWSPDEGKIAFQSNRAGGSQIFTVNADGTGVTQVTNASGTNSAPDWSPDGQKIAFHSSRDGDFDLYTINPDGTGTQNLTNTLDVSEGELNPTWSPSSARIGFLVCSFAGCPSGEIFRIDADGTDPDRITPSGGNFFFSGTHPSWSPNGEHIIYENSQYGMIFANDPNDDAGTDYEVPIQGTEGDGYTDPSWQPDVQSYVRPVGATPIRDALVPAHAACNASNAIGTHEAPFAQPACVPPQQTSSYLTVGTPDVNNNPPKMSGFHRMSVIPGIPSTPADEADISLEVNVTDVRNKNGLSDYGGELETVANLRITDRRNGGFGAGTVTDLPLRYAVDCVPTSDTTVGSTCDIDTTADALFPGAVRESKRSIWEVHGVQVFDGGSDGVASTQNNTLFAVEGVFVP